MPSNETRTTWIYSRAGLQFSVSYLRSRVITSYPARWQSGIAYFAPLVNTMRGISGYLFRISVAISWMHGIANLLKLSGVIKSHMASNSWIMCAPFSICIQQKRCNTLVLYCKRLPRVMGTPAATMQIGHTCRLRYSTTILVRRANIASDSSG